LVFILQLLLGISNSSPYSQHFENEEGVVCMGKKRNAYRVMVGNSVGKRSLVRRRCRWHNNIKINLQEM